MMIAVTRLKGKDAQDAVRCAKYGHSCFSVSPLKAIIHQDRVRAFVDMVAEGAFDCIFFASALPAAIIAPLLPQWPRVIAIGPQTAHALERAGIPCEILPSFYSRDLVPYLGIWIHGKRIGIPRADLPNSALIESITQAGGIPVEIRCYALIPTDEELELHDAEGILFTSAESFRRAIWKRNPDLLVMAIGDVTARVMRDAGIAPDLVGDGSLEGTLKVLNRYISEEQEGSGII
jgi:uroporphyrinogen-III synthase